MAGSVVQHLDCSHDLLLARAGSNTISQEKATPKPKRKGRPGQGAGKIPNIPKPLTGPSQGSQYKAWSCSCTLGMASSCWDATLVMIPWNQQALGSAQGEGWCPQNPSRIPRSLSLCCYTVKLYWKLLPQISNSFKVSGDLHKHQGCSKTQQQLLGTLYAHET